MVLDPYQATRFGDCGLQFLGDAGLAELVEFHAEESQIALPRFLTAERSFDLAFVDGNHRFDGVFLDFVCLGRLLRAGGIVFVDDYQLPAVARAASFCLRILGGRTKKCQRRTVSTSGRFFALHRCRTRDHSTTSLTPESPFRSGPRDIRARRARATAVDNSSTLQRHALPNLGHARARTLSPLRATAGRTRTGCCRDL